MGNARLRRRAVFLVVCCLLVLACSGKSSNQALTTNAEQSLTFVSNDQNSALSQSINQDYQADLIQPLATWSASTSIWQTSIQTNKINEIHGPNLVVSDLGQQFISVHKNSELNASSKDYRNQEGLAFKNDINQGWALNLPFVADPTIHISDIEVQVESVTGGAYALWESDQTLLVNHLGATDIWGQPVTVWSGDGGVNSLRERYLLTDTNGIAWIFWINDIEMNLSQFFPADAVTPGLQPVNKFQITNILSFAKPVMSSLGTISVAWVTAPEDPTLTNMLELVQFNPATGWSAVQTAPLMKGLNPMSTHLNIVSTVEDQVMIMSQDGFGRIFVIGFDPLLGWSNWENIDYNLGTNDIIAHSSKLAANASGAVMAVWSEEIILPSNEASTRVYASVYDPIGDSNNVHWPLPTLVGTNSNRINPNAVDQVDYKTFPLIELLADGRAITVWLDSTQLNSNLYASIYIPGSGWQLPDQIVSYEKLVDGVVRSADLAVAQDGHAYIAWQQLSGTEFAKQYEFWISDSLL